MEAANLENERRLQMNEVQAEDDPPEPYYRFSATLRVFGVIPDLDYISQLLMLKPTVIYRKGEPNPKRRSVPYEMDMWQFTAPVPRELPLDDHLSNLWMHIQGRVPEILELKRTATVNVFLTFFSNCSIGGLEIAWRRLKLFTELEIPLDLAITVA